MAVIFVLRTSHDKGMATLFARVRSRKLKIDFKVDTLVEVDIEQWKKAQSSTDNFRKFRKSAEGSKLFSKLDILESSINAKLDAGEVVTPDAARKIVEDVMYKEIREEEERRRLEEEAKAEAERKRIEAENRMTLDKYLQLYVSQISSGQRANSRGKVFTEQSIKTIKTIVRQFEAFEKFSKRHYDFDDIDLNFRNKFQTFLYNQKKYSANTVAKCLNNLITILGCAEAEGYTSNNKFHDRRFRGVRVDVDSIYLTKDELRRMCEVDLSGLSRGHEIARDIFMVGVYTAQRVSDYNNIVMDDIRVYDDGKVIIQIRQQKTGVAVYIPAKPELVKILEKYDYKLPHLVDQKINLYIKEIGKLAKIDEMVEVETSKSGVFGTERIPKYKLIQTHTARRTGATLMYLAGMNVFNICAVTGHTSIKSLKKYIKADSLQKAETILSDEAFMKW